MLQSMELDCKESDTTEQLNCIIYSKVYRLVYSLKDFPIYVYSSNYHSESFLRDIDFRTLKCSPKLFSNRAS